MAKYIPDSKNHRWVILAPSREGKPHAVVSSYHITQQNGMKIAKQCPFCPGNEEHTPCEIETIQGPNGWQIRVFANKFPITNLH